MTQSTELLALRYLYADLTVLTQYAGGNSIRLHHHLSDIFAAPRFVSSPMIMSTPHILLIGGHGKVAQLLTPLLLKRSWVVTSLIRDPAQKPTILKLAEGQPGKLAVQIESLEELKGSSDAQKVVDEVKPDWIVWSAGAGGKGGPSRTFKIDRDAAKYFIHAAYSTPSVTKFLMISYNSSRRQKPSWWSEDEWAVAMDTNNGALSSYFQSKVTADYYLSALEAKAKEQGTPFDAINLRPGHLTDEGVEKVQLGKGRAKGEVGRATVAEVAANLLEMEGARGWIDLLSGEESIGDAVKRVVTEKVDCIDGEDWNEIKKVADQRIVT
ncbi:hypothetical protein M501DRAFT_990293 [Patellaria atrata CBS 101060]|uniref:NAD(P)-binding domain-containing protein n=1 Tax=Patellaria atrata CBS 101060 TaxID=1346257 RepID=A0A9P4S170_9PEZI|nr:hypothetical protein M501DRAFT_990293 [Patellaria atrata CBS 101060]